jgi:hypothetical protein
MDLKINLPPPRHTIVPFPGKIGYQKKLSASFGGINPGCLFGYSANGAGFQLGA